MARLFYEWDLETCDGDEVLDHHHAQRLRDLPTPADKNQKLVLVRDDVNSGRSWAYVDESGMLPAYFSVPAEDGKYYETDIPVPQIFHREIAREMAR